MSGFGILARPGLKPWPAFVEEGRAPIQRPPEGAQAMREAATVRDPHRAAWPVELTAAPANGVSALVLDQADGIRNLLMFRNASASANVYLGFGRAASTSSILALAPGDIVLFDTVCPQCEIHAMADAAGASLAIAFSQYAI